MEDLGYISPLKSWKEIYVFIISLEYGSDISMEKECSYIDEGIEERYIGLKIEMEMRIIESWFLYTEGWKRNRGELGIDVDWECMGGSFEDVVGGLGGSGGGLRGNGEISLVAEWWDSREELRGGRGFANMDADVEGVKYKHEDGDMK
ncbi:predicted protein [Sclerotinia sclerotiorum 1980 UF-70]|uniref:Uncharacterized protein n=1 Tax=Sclerotinia sclerotiorum (strain ATCC 18683 / 1980 / Ss-1) TaxID=665079 RepID=A7ELF6_SCLS1|nr:predicted protein [Sclerotinia sclerotiorum 1980 UF-70]EDO03672.1 predicted protein [Sclerotinia sclerotiorum 1980 UF-70]